MPDRETIIRSLEAIALHGDFGADIVGPVRGALALLREQETRMPDNDRAIPADWEARVDELSKTQDMICRMAVLRHPVDAMELTGWIDCALMLVQQIQDHINEISQMTDKPFTED